MVDEAPLVWRIAVRNVARHRRRSLITALSIAFGFWLAAIFSGISNYSYVSMIDSSASMGFGHVTVLPQNYLDMPSLKLTVSGVDSLGERLRKDARIRNAAPRIIGQGMVATASRSLAAQLIAIDPSQERIEDNLLSKSLVRGEPLDASAGPWAIVGDAMAAKLDLELGKKLVYTVTDVNGEMTSQLARVKGIFDAGADEIDEFVIGLPIDTLRNALGYRDDQATMVAILLHDNRDSRSVRDALRQVPELARSDNMVVHDWKETQPDLAGFVAMDEGSMRVFVGFVAVLVALGVLNTMLMSVLERQREFGVMLALGTGPWLLVRMIAIESTVIGIVGILIGIGLFLPWHWFLREVGIDISSLYAEDITAGGAVVDTTLRSTIFPEQMFFITFGLLLLTIAAALYPAIKAARTVPVDSMRALH